MSQHAIDNARAWFASIKEMVEAAENEESDNSEQDQLDAVDRIHESTLSVLVRSGWYLPGSPTMFADKGGPSAAPIEYEILLTTGGPALMGSRFLPDIRGLGGLQPIHAAIGMKPDRQSATSCRRATINA